jgi:PAS domain S-box-containing protein
MFQKIKNKLILLIVFILLAYASTVIYLKIKEKDLLKSITNEQSLVLKEIITEQLLKDNFNDYLIDFLNSDVSAKTDYKGIAEKLLSTNKIAYFWIFNKDYKLLNQSPKSPSPDWIHKLSNQNQIGLLFKVFDDQLYQIKSKNVYKDNNPLNTHASFATIIYAVKFDQAFMNQLTLSAGATINIINREEKDFFLTKISDKPFISSTFINLPDEKGNSQKILFAQNVSQVIGNKNESLSNEYLILVFVFLFFALVIVVVLFMQVVRPISTIISSFITKKPEQLKKLQHDKSEYGVFANFIKEFYDQQKNLEEEIKVRKITQEELETLNDELEKRVSDRTEELGITNLELQKERDQTKQYLDIAGTIIAILDVDGYIQLINKKGDEVLGYQPGELIGRNWFDTCVQAQDKLNLKKMYNEAMLGKRVPVEFIINDVITKGKENRTLMFHNTFLKDSNHNYTGLLFSAEDITELKLKEKELIEAKEKADESNKLKSTFLANMSHELRTPMIGILGYSDLLMTELKNENHKKMARTIQDSGQRLIDTLNLILDLSRLEANKQNINYQVVNLNDLVRNVSFHFEAAAGRKNLFLKLNVPSYDVVAKTDVRIIRDILNNLINNALKFTKDGGVFIKLEVFHRDFVIAIKDTGIGIPKESLGLIFEEFRQVSEGINRGFQGTGLGLTICKKYIELLGGQISVKSSPGQGSEFTFQVPLISENSSNADVAKTDIQDEDIEERLDKIKSIEFVKKKILIVEDDVTSRDVIKLFLKNIYNVEFASNGETALKLVQDNKYDLILMDINLGLGISGIEVTNHIRSIEHYKNVPIIAATAFAMLGDREKFLAKGFDHYISKPYLKKQLLKLIADIFQD